MEKVRIDTVENSIQPATVMRKLTKALGTTDLAINYYELEPGDSFAFAYHQHEVQEELFYVQAGTATFETEAGAVDVDAGEIIRFAPGEFQRGWNRGAERVIALALGAPLAYGTQTKLRDCLECGEATDTDLERRTDGDVADHRTDDCAADVVVATCKICGTETGRWTEGSMPGTVP